MFTRCHQIGSRRQWKRQLSNMWSVTSAMNLIGLNEVNTIMSLIDPIEFMVTAPQQEVVEHMAFDSVETCSFEI